jgi:hypothetical protein
MGDHVDQHVHLNKASKDAKAQWSEAAQQVEFAVDNVGNRA